jgi:hypothetical protein
MDAETTKIVATSAIQLFLGAGAWFFGWKIARAQLHNQRSDIRIKLFEQRYVVYSAFKDFISNCVVSDRYSDASYAAFQEGTDKIEFLFGPEVRKYYREVTANALAVRGLVEGLPCEAQPVVGGIVGYFKGSAVLTDLPSLRSWFFQQHKGDLYRYFSPYLDYGSAGVDPGAVSMIPPVLPDPPLIRRAIENEKNG